MQNPNLGLGSLEGVLVVSWDVYGVSEMFFLHNSVKLSCDVCLFFVTGNVFVLLHGKFNYVDKFKV